MNEIDREVVDKSYRHELDKEILHKVHDDIQTKEQAVPTLQQMESTFPPGMVAEIEAYLKTDRAMRGLDIYPGVFETQTFYPLQRKEELKWMMYQARTIRPTTIMEIGADKGGGLYHWCKCITTVRNVIACEIRGMPYARAFERAFPHINFLWLHCSSRDKLALEEMQSFLRGVAPVANKQKLDCLFLDGEKACFREDFETYLPFMQRPGRVFMHDVNDSDGPSEAYHEISKRYDGSQAYLDVREWQAEEKRMLAGDPVRTPYEGWLRYWKGCSCGVGMVIL